MVIEQIVSGYYLAKSGFEILNIVREISGASVISAYFRHDTTHVMGSKKINVDIHPDSENKAIWWYSVQLIDDYIFIRTPLIESCAHEMVGTEEGKEQPDARYWRWVAPTLPGQIYGGEAVNLKVDFLVYGYKPKALIKHFSTR